MRRLKFFLPQRYFSKHSRSNLNTCSRATMIDILRKSFGLNVVEVGEIMDACPCGFTIVCRPDQFAKFIVLRYEADECVNGVKDLNPKFVDRDHDLYEDIADATGVSRDDVKKVAHMLRFNHAANPRSTVYVYDRCNEI